MIEKMGSDWNEEQRIMFGRMYRFMLVNQHVMRSRKSEPIPEEEWEILCHNVAWLSAAASVGSDISILDGITGKVVSDVAPQVVS